MGEPSRGQDVILDIFLEGGLLETIQPQSMSFNQKSTKDSQLRCGERYEQPRLKLHGWEGDFEFEEDSPVLEDLIDLIEKGYYEGKRVVRLDASCTTFYPNTGEVRSYTWPEIVCTVNRSVSGKNDENKGTLNWSGAKRERIGG